MKKILVSIIIPVYNSSNYLDQCINSLITQTYNNIELIFINDGSTDNSLDILNKYKNDKRIKIINQKNSGANLARVRGLKCCHGDYVMFVDSDDYILPNTVSELVEIIVNEEPDIVKFKFVNFENFDLKINGKINKDLVLKYLLISNGLNNITNEIVSRKIINLDDDVFKIKSSTAEDLMINLSFFDNATNIIFTDNKYYYYMLNDNSTTKTVDINRIILSIKETDMVFEILLKYSKRWNINSDEIISKMQFDNIYSICSKIIRIIDNNMDGNTISLINETLDSIIITKCNYKKIISENEKHLLNRRLYLNILNRNYKRAKFLLLIKLIIVKIIR